MIERIATGIPGLDELVGGGFPKGSLILLSGAPGSGKTNFAAHFLHRGAMTGERGIYFSLAESKQTFLNNMSTFGLDFEKLERDNKFKFIDLIPTREVGVAESLQLVLDEIHSMKAARLVLDSYTALAAALKEPIDTRILTHTVLGKMTRQAGCTTILISETAPGQPNAGLGAEEFVADGVIRLGGKKLENGMIREITIEKLRGTELRRQQYVFTLHKGFEVFSLASWREVEKPKKYEPILDAESHFSSGCRDLDRLLGGGFPKKAVVLYEAWLPGRYLGASYLLHWLNFLAQGRGVVILPKEGLDAHYVREQLIRYIDRKMLDKYLRVLEKRDETPSEPYVVRITGDTKADFNIWKQTVADLKRATGDKPVLWWVGVDRMEVMYSYEDLIRLLSDCQVQAQRGGDLTIRRIPGEVRSRDMVAHMSSIHLKFADPHGSLLLMGVKPVFEPQNLAVDTSKGYPQVVLRPII